MGLKYLYLPSGVKAGTAYGVMPNSANADFSSFSRSSAGSRVDKNGFINTGLGLGSEEVVNGTFDTDSNWSKDTGWSISGGLATRTNTGSYGALYQNCLTNGKQYEVTITITSITSQGFFGVRLGTNYVLRGITEAGTYTETGTSTSATLSVMGNPTFAGSIDNISVREITDVNTDVPRLDYTGGGCPSLLLEPASTNLIGYSEDFTQSSWTKENNPTIESNVEISPTGSLNGSYLKAPFSATSTSPRIAYFFAATSGQTYTGSVFVKKDNIDYIRLLSTGATASTLQAYYNVSNGTLGSAGSPDKAKIEDYGNGWYRLSLVINATQNTGSATFRVQLAKGDNNPASTFDGTEKNIIFGGQLEQQSYATSYIPTYGAASTRSADVAGGTGDLSSVINDSEGVLMAEMAWINNDLDVNADLSLSDNSTSNRVLITQTTTKNQIEMFFRGTGATISQFFTLNDTSNFNKFAIKYKSTDFAFYINGLKLFESNSVATVSNLFDLSFDNPSGGGTRNFYGNTKQIRIYDTILSDSELEELTSWSSFVEMANGQQYTIE